MAIRTLRVTAPSTETKGEIEPIEEIKKSLATIDSNRLNKVEASGVGTQPFDPSGIGDRNPDTRDEFDSRREFNTNFSTKQSFEDDDFLSEQSGSKLEAIPEEMLNHTEEKIPLPNVTGESKARIEALMHEFRDLFKSIVSDKLIDSLLSELKK